MTSLSDASVFLMVTLYRSVGLLVMLSTLSVQTAGAQGHTDCNSLPPAFPNMAAYFRQTITAISTEAEAFPVVNGTIRCTGVDGVSCDDTMLTCAETFNSKAANDSRCQLANDNSSTEQPTLRLGSVAMSTGNDVIVIACVCVVIGVPLVSIVTTLAVRRCRSVRHRRHRVLNESLRSTSGGVNFDPSSADHTNGQTRDGRDISSYARELSETGSQLEMLPTDGTWSQPTMSTPPPINNSHMTTSLSLRQLKIHQPPDVIASTMMTDGNRPSMYSKDRDDDGNLVIRPPRSAVSTDDGFTPCTVYLPDDRDNSSKT